MKTTKNIIPAEFRPFLWSYDPGALDLDKNKKRIITNILNLGTKDATDLLFKIYPRKEIIKAVAEPLPGEWGKKSLNYWCLILNVEKKNALRSFR
ncbi:MAG: hypothetical protein MUC28_03120 [Planctomycetes bacterium]|nr:hypothetical protein [Planctomycetota bacterium]